MVPIDELTVARAALATAQAAHTEAELEHRQAKRALAKLQPPSFSGKKANHLEMSDKLFESIQSAEMKASESHGALQLAALNVRLAHGDIQLELELAETEKRAAAERAARQRERAAEAEARDAERNAAEAERARARVWLEQMKQRSAARRAGRHFYRMSRHLHMCAALDEIEAAEAREATRARLEADAAKMWGSASADKENLPAAAQVISLVGMSAESLRAEACSRGVRVGVEYELMGHQVLQKCKGEYAVGVAYP